MSANAISFLCALIGGGLLLARYFPRLFLFVAGVGGAAAFAFVMVARAGGL